MSYGIDVHFNIKLLIKQVNQPLHYIAPNRVYENGSHFKCQKSYLFFVVSKYWGGIKGKTCQWLWVITFKLWK